MPEDPYSDPVTGVLHNKLGLSTAAKLEAAEREITHAALILLDESPVLPSYDDSMDPSRRSWPGATGPAKRVRRWRKPSVQEMSGSTRSAQDGVH